MYGESLDIDAGMLTLIGLATFLHENPGARRVWKEREDRLIRDRNVLIPDVADQSTWRDTIQANLEKLDQLQTEDKSE